MSPGTDQIPTERIKAGGRKIRCEIHKLINSIWNREEFPKTWKESIVVPFYKNGEKQIVVIIVAHHFFQLRRQFYPISCCQG